MTEYNNDITYSVSTTDLIFNCPYIFEYHYKINPQTILANQEDILTSHKLMMEVINENYKHYWENPNLFIANIKYVAGHVLRLLLAEYNVDEYYISKLSDKEAYKDEIKFNDLNSISIPVHAISSKNIPLIEFEFKLSKGHLAFDGVLLDE